MDSFTTQDSTYYSTAPFNWLTDTNLYNVTPNNLNPGLFLRNDNPTTNRIDQESTLVGLDNVIGKCETVDVTSLTKAKELSTGLQKVYDVAPLQNNTSSQLFLNNTRLIPEDSVTEKSFDRFTPLLHNPQVPCNIIANGERGGSWSRNDFKDNYTCPVFETRGNK